MPNSKTFESINLAELAQCLFEESSDALFLVNASTLQLVEVNSQAQSICQRTRKELLGASLSQVLTPDTIERIREWGHSSPETEPFRVDDHDAVSLSSGRANKVYVSVRRFIRDDETLWLLAMRETLDPNPDALESRSGPSVEDASRADQAAFELNEETHRLRSILDDIDAIVWEASFPSLEFSFVSKQAERILGYPVEQWKEEPNFWVDHLNQQDAMTCISECEELAAQGLDHEMEYRMVAADGRDVWVHDVVRIVKDDQGHPVKLRGVMVDVTERVIAETRRAQLDEQLRKSERQLAHVARLSTMGEMVAGISHEINQPLSAIANFANAAMQLLDQSESEPSPQIQSWMQQIAEQAVRCGDIIRRLRGFARKNESQGSIVNVKAAIEESHRISRDVAREHFIDFLIDVPQELTVRVNEVEFQQVIVNLIRNACDAVVEGESENATIRMIAAHCGDRVRISVEDNGPGIDLESQEHLFDPFFSTRPEGLGMGLGISRTIVKNHGGDLYWDREFIEGARFVIELPSDHTNGDSKGAELPMKDCTSGDSEDGMVKDSAAEELGLRSNGSGGESVNASLEQSLRS